MTCEACDVCRNPDADRAPPPREPTIPLSAEQRQLVLDAIAHHRRAVGKGNLAKALRGSRAKAVSAQGLVHLPQYGQLAALDEPSIIAAIDQLIRERKLVRRGRKYPTVALPSTPSRRDTRPARPRPTRSISSIKLELDTFRKRTARQLKWKSYMVLQRATIAAIDAQRPATIEALARIPGLGPSKIARFGTEILAVVRRHAD
ncbi:MAG TPA: HRDC domain-containing protein, partial [Kofleriaceae bacterium]